MVGVDKNKGLVLCMSSQVQCNFPTSTLIAFHGFEKVWCYSELIGIG